MAKIYILFFPLYISILEKKDKEIQREMEITLKKILNVICVINNFF